MDDPVEHEEPELLGYEPMEQRPLYSRRRRQAMRVLVLVAVAALVVPGILSTVSLAANTAQQTCAVYVARYQPNAVGASVHFDLFGPRGPGWDCYTLDTAQNETFLVLLGLIPSAPLPPAELTGS
ncbi:hypothetical protein [Leifsonia sp. Root112D2]|jgi:hypothetical protein|uniref:hypothetical protein n=1 Tax=Leifsonia sp. Root112D2 TaxID=1736426 RepID=UPI0006F4D62F|nr:hypothetical protein [Leifsonia sp. Root112D2]KQV07447.1 hypothetical protein ASC63_09210 [Leifsonia sp. Root112D2]